MPTPLHLLPPGEENRLRALHGFDVAAALREPIFQKIVELVARIYQLPIVFITVVEGERVNFVVTHGIPGLDTLPREQALCSLAVSQQHTLALNNLLTAPANPHQRTAQKLGLEAYVGAPITLENDQAVGVFCLSSPVAREFSSGEVLVLEELATLVSQLIIARQLLLAKAAAAQWQAVQQQATNALQELDGLLNYLAERQDILLPTSSSLLASVQHRLEAVQLLLQRAADAPHSSAAAA